MNARPETTPRRAAPAGGTPISNDEQEKTMTTTDTTPTTTEAAPGEAGAALVHLDPATLVIETNVRAAARLDEGLVASIAERGVLTPVVAHRREDGTVAVIYGQRRTLGAVQAGRESIPVHIVASPAESDRLVDQMAENDHRASLTTGERVAGFAQLAVLGLSAAQIAKRTATKPDQVAAALSTATSTVAAAVVERFDFLTLDQGAVLAEFEHSPETVKALVAAARTGQFDHVAQRARDERALDEQREAVAADLREAGIEVIETPRWDAAPTRLDWLHHDGKPLTVEAHAACPGHAAYVRHDVEWHDPDQDDDQDDDDDEPEPMVARTRPERVETMTPVYVCLDPKKHGHTNPNASGASGRTPAADKSEAQRKADAAARRDVIDSNKAWESAVKVRQDWLRGFAARKSAPKEAPQFIAATITSAGYAIARAADDRHALARDLLGAPITVGAYPLPALTTEKTTSPRATVITLVLLLAAYESSTNRNCWRSPDEGTTRYLRFLATQGYALAPVERRACGEEPQPDEVDEQVDPDQPTT